MPSHSETGHAKNVANFEDLISFCKSYGNNYNPAREALKITSLQALRASALASLQGVKSAKAAFDSATNTRVTTFKNLRTLSSRVVNALAASGSNGLIVSDARTIIRKIYGKRAGTVATPEVPAVPATPAEPTPKSISVSQQSYDSLIDHFTKLVELVSIETTYEPNEADLSVAGLGTLLTQMQTANTDVINNYTSWSNSRIQRDDVLYNPVKGILHTALSVKLYVKSLYGPSSPQYKQVSGIRFSDLTGR